MWSADRQAADPSSSPGLEVAGRAVDQLALVGVDEHLDVRKALVDRVELRHVVVVMVGEQDVGDVEPRLRRSSSGRTGPPASTRNASPPGPAATRYVFDSQSGCIERSTIMGGER